MKRLLLLALLLTPALTANATTIEITSGRVQMTQLMGFWTCAEIIGGACVTSGLLMPPLDGTTTLSQWEILPTSPTASLVLNFVYTPIDFNDTPEDLFGKPPVAVPFTMTGLWTLKNGGEFDLAGQGTLHCCTEPYHDGFPLIAVRFIFGPAEVTPPVPAPEPQPLLLLGLSLPLILMFRRRDSA